MPGIGSGANSVSQQWLRMDALGNVNAIQVLMKQLLVQLERMRMRNSRHELTHINVPAATRKRLHP